MDTKLTHRVDGDGPTLLLLNGGLMSIAAWDPVASHLVRGFRVVRFDFRGQLLSPGPARANMLDHSADVVALLDHLGERKVHMVGTSFGAEVAILVAARHPERVASLSCITATEGLSEEGDADSVELRDAVDAAARGGDGRRVFDALVPLTFSDAWLAANPGFAEQRRAVFASLPPRFYEGLAGLMDALSTLDLQDDLPRVAAPTLILGAELDRIFPPRHSEALARSIPGARLEIIESVGHGAVVEATDRVIDLVCGFLAPLGGVTTDRKEKS